MDAAQLFVLFREMMDAQHCLSDVMRQGIENAHQVAMTTVERVTRVQPPGGQAQPPRLGTIIDFQRMRPKDFCGTEGILYADDWIEHIEGICRLA